MEVVPSYPSNRPSDGKSPHSTTGSPLLSLPASLRRRIYLHAGLIEGAKIVVCHVQHSLPTQLWKLEWNQMEWDDWNEWNERNECNEVNGEIDSCLQLVCKTIHSEVNEIFYSENRFLLQPYSLRPHGPAQLIGLQLSTPETIAHLTHLEIYLHCTACDPHCGCDTLNPRKLDESALSLSSETHRALLKQWTAAMTKILTYARQDRLKLYLACDVAGYEEALSVVQTLTLAHTLAKCSIRLSPEYDPVLHTLARDTARHATGMVTNHQIPFRYLDLPSEIRDRILNYTDLVTPAVDVEWAPNRGFDLRFCEDDCHCLQGTVRLDGFPCYCQIRPCWLDEQHGHFCSRTHSAYHDECKCWYPPTALFLICRSVRDDVERVFFNRNRIVIMPFDDPADFSDCSKTALESNPSRRATSIFFTKAMRPAALQHLRSLEIVVPPWKQGYFPEGREVHQDWEVTLSTLKHSLALPSLTLCVRFALQGSEYLDPDREGHTTDFRYNITNDRCSINGVRGINIQNTYLRILRPMARYFKVKRFYIYLTLYYDAFLSAQRKNELRALEEQIGKDVLRSDYERLSIGKARHPYSAWAQQYECVQDRMEETHSTSPSTI